MATTLTNLDPDILKNMYRVMVRIAECDSAIQRGLSAGELQFQYYPCGGQEAVAAALGANLAADDYMVTTYRGIHDIVAKGTPVREILAEMYGRSAGTSKGKGGPMHLSDPNSGLMVTTGIVGAGIPIANGLALATRLNETGQVTSVSFGDGAANIGAFHEAMNLAALWQLPVVFVCQNNQYAEYTSLAESSRSKSLAQRAEAYGMSGVQVDGTDPVALHSVFAAAIGRARSGQGPTLVEAICPRLQGHAFGSEQTHMDQEALQAALDNAPIKTYRAALIEQGVATEDELVTIETEARREVDDGMEFAGSAEVPGAAELYNDVFADTASIPDLGAAVTASVAKPKDTGGDQETMTFCAAVNHTLDLALGADERVFLMGEDIQDPAGGVVKATAGLSTKYGLDRVRPTPISEQAIVGAAIGASLAGMRPVAEIMINDFLAVCMDQVANHAAKLRYMSGGRTNVPITIRTLTAGNVGSFGAQHSQSLEAWLTHIPGLKVVFASTPADAKGLLTTCIEDDDPCVFFESMRLYFTPGPVPMGRHTVPLGLADIKRDGSDLTILSYGWALAEALAAAGQLAGDGVSAEVVDLRSLVPLDRQTILNSVAKTRRALVTHSAVQFCGFGAELATLISSELHGDLAAPVARVGAKYSPIAFSQSLEALHFPNATTIYEAARHLMD
jgi:pyruvate/2-oxoglutarate/acetoin dehydrogenase E1 component/TPP-dependent pyruvate/acetoin dehydrogenase alpha subunit